MLELLIASCEPLANSLKLCRREIKVPWGLVRAKVRPRERLNAIGIRYLLKLELGRRPKIGLCAAYAGHGFVIAR